MKANEPSCSMLASEASEEASILSWVAVKELKLSYHSGYT